jgi:mRNA interferase HigB
LFPGWEIFLLFPAWERATYLGVRIISRSTLRDFWEDHRDSEVPLKAWIKVVTSAHWQGPADVKALFRSASFVGDRIVFNVGGNNYRLIVGLAYDVGIVYIKFVGTHAEYDKINVAEV